MITHEKLLSVVSYDAETGIFTWLQSTSRRAVVGRVVGSHHRMGYLEARICGHRFLLHRLAWFYVHGSMPTGVIDHINGEKKDNRICNLRDVSQVENGLNRQKANKNSKTGARGVVWHEGAKKYMARVGEKYLGLFDALGDAKAAVEKEVSRLL